MDDAPECLRENVRAVVFGTEMGNANGFVEDTFAYEMMAYIDMLGTGVKLMVLCE